MPKTRNYLSEVKSRVQLVRDLLHLIHKTKTSLNDHSAFHQLSQAVQDIEIETLLAFDKKHKKVCELIHHILYTPWGAPFVSRHSLLASAQTYKFQDHFESDLYEFIKNFLEHDEASLSQIFGALDDIILNLEAP
jgi:hypothetical protein